MDIAYQALLKQAEKQTSLRPMLATEIVAPITCPIDRQILLSELTPDKLIRTYQGLNIYLVTAADSPRMMTEIGRIREIELRREGGGTRQPKDIDIFDQGLIPYQQFVVWDPIYQDIVATARYILGKDAMRLDGSLHLATAQLFDFSRLFKEQYLPKTIEIDRVVVNHSARRRRLGLLSIGYSLGALVREYPDIRYFLAKVSIAPIRTQTTSSLLLQFFQQSRLDSQTLVRPKVNCRALVPVPTRTAWSKCDPTTAFTTPNRVPKQIGQSIPLLVILNRYLEMSDRLRYYSSAFISKISNTVEGAILIPIAAIKAKPRWRFIDSYTSINSPRFQALSLQSGTNSLAADIAYLENSVRSAIAKQREAARTSNQEQSQLKADELLVRSPKKQNAVVHQQTSRTMTSMRSQTRRLLVQSS